VYSRIKNDIETNPVKVGYAVGSITTAFNLLSKALTVQMERATTKRITKETRKAQDMINNQSVALRVGFVKETASGNMKNILNECGLNLSCTLEGEFLLIKSPLVNKQWFASALQISIGLIEILADYDKKNTFFEVHNLKTIVSCMHPMMECDTYLDFIKLIKYATTWMHARSLKQDVLPEAPTFWKGGPPLLFSGSIRRLLSDRLVSGNKPVNQKLFWSIAQSKRCAAVVPQSFIYKSLISHSEAMEKVADPCDETFLEMFSIKLNNIVNNMNINSDISKVFEYSTNACFENSKTAGGAKDYLLYGHRKTGYTSNNELLKMDFCPYKGIMERRGYMTYDFNELLTESVVTYLYDNNWNIIGSKEDKLDIQCRAKVYSIAEPLKIRNITASNAKAYAVAKGMQRFMHSNLKQYKQFALIGAPLSEDFVNNFFNIGRKDDLIASGDFSAATDNIKIELTKMVFERILQKLTICQNLSPYHANILRRVLYEHEIHYDDKTLIPTVQQMNGQLMGSVESFPILCIINLIVYWMAVCPEIQDFKELNVMVNGDDIMFKCNKSEYNDWLDMLPQAGLTPSPGKNFLHKKFGTVNSALFYQDKNRTKYLPFFNVGMLLGQSKVVSDREGAKKPIHCLHQCAMHGATNKIRADLRFRAYNKEALTKASKMFDGTQLNWYLPRTMGGLGMILPDGVSLRGEYDPLIKGNFVTVTNKQRIIAYGLRKAWYVDDLCKAPFKPIGMEVDPDLENWGDISKKVFMQAQLRSCPQLPNCYDFKKESHPPNWYLPSTSCIDLTNLQYTFKGLSFQRFGEKIENSDNNLVDNKKFIKYKVGGHTISRMVTRSHTGLNDINYKMIDINNPHLYEEIVVYRKSTSRLDPINLALEQIKKEKDENLRLEYLYQKELKEDYESSLQFDDIL